MVLEATLRSHSVCAAHLEPPRDKPNLPLAPFGAAPETRALMQHARRELTEGIPEDEIRHRTLERAKKETLAGIRVLSPGLTRRVLRASAPFTRALADDFADYQLKSPFEVLVKDSTGALRTEKWAILDLNQ